MLKRVITFRGKLQTYLFDYAQTLLTAKLAVDEMADEWDVVPNLSRPVATSVPASPANVSGPAANQNAIASAGNNDWVDLFRDAKLDAKGAKGTWRRKDSGVVAINPKNIPWSCMCGTHQRMPASWWN